MRKGEVLLVSGSLRHGSYNTALLREAAKAIPSGAGHAALVAQASVRGARSAWLNA